MSRTAKDRLRALSSTHKRAASFTDVQRPHIQRRLNSPAAPPSTPPVQFPGPSTSTATGPSLSDFGFRFTQDIQEALPDTPTADVAPHAEAPTVGIPLNTIDEDLEDVLVNHGVSGKVFPVLRVQNAHSRHAQGQNEMSHEWLKGCAQRYLNQILICESSGNVESSCDDCNAPCPRFICRDCLNNALLCAACIRRCHKHFPCHRFGEWKGQHFEDIDSSKFGLILHLGHGGNECNLGKTMVFTLGDITGIHSLNVRFCRHPGSVDFPKQLLDAQIFPCSDKRPKTWIYLHCAPKVSSSEH